MEFLRYTASAARVTIPILLTGTDDWRLTFKITVRSNNDIHILGPESFANNTYRWLRLHVPNQEIRFCGAANFGFSSSFPIEVNETCVVDIVSSIVPEGLFFYKNGELVSSLPYTCPIDGFTRIGSSSSGGYNDIDLYYLELQNGDDSRHYSAAGITSGTVLPDLINPANNGILSGFTGNHWLDDSLFTAPSTVTPGVEFTSTVLAPFVNGPAMLAFHGVNVPVTISGGSFTTTMPLFVDDAVYPRVPLNGSLILTQGTDTANIFRAIGMPANTETLRTPQGTISNFYDIITDNDEFLGYQFAQANNPLTTADTLYWDNSNGLVFEPESVYDVPEGAAPFTTTLWVRRGSSGKMFSHDFSLSSEGASILMDLTNWYQQSTVPYFDGLNPSTPRS
jgi:hypothetical protein